jgi:hypothetical protein
MSSQRSDLETKHGTYKREEHDPIRAIELSDEEVPAVESRAR